MSDIREKAARKAISEAREFIRAAEAWLAVEADMRCGATAQGGAMNRKSMDLARTLARLRNPYRVSREG